jgi:predicted HicB family RNase H-like nuclease
MTLEAIVRELLARGTPTAGPPGVRLTVRVVDSDHAQLVKLADRMGISKTRLAEELLSAAIMDAFVVSLEEAGDGTSEPRESEG